MGNNQAQMTQEQREYIQRLNSLPQNHELRQQFKQQLTQQNIQQFTQQNIQQNSTQEINQLRNNELERKTIKRREEKREQAKLEYQRKRRDRFVKELNELKLDKVDPYQLFSLDKNFTLEQLKKTYKKYALRYHPDRPNGDEYKFKIITKVYMFLFEEYKKRENDKQFNELRNGSRDFIKKQQKMRHKKLNKDKFDINLFNKIYSENRLFDPNDEGYGDWFKSTQEKPQNTKLFSKSFNSSVFNTVFNEEKNTHYNDSREIIEYKDPSAQETSIDYSNIGQDKIKDFTSRNNSNMNFSDLKKAYNNPYLVDSRNVETRDYNSVNRLKSERSKISFQMTEEEQQRRNTMNERLAAEEEFRRGRVREQDKLIEEHYNRMNHMFLERF